MRPIDADAALKALRKCQTYLYDARDPELKIELSSAEAAINNLPTIQPVATDTNVGNNSEIPNSSDTTNRQQAIDALDTAIEHYDGIAEECRKKADIERNDYMDMRDDAYEARQLAQWLNELKYLREKIEQLTIKPEPQWIPCSERMPEEHEWLGTKKFGTTISDEVYVTFENEKGERFCQHLSFQNGELSRYDQFHMDTWYKGSKPIAWMPLPVPYQRGGEEDVRKPD